MRHSRVYFIIFALVSGVCLTLINGYFLSSAKAPLAFTVNTTLDSHDINKGDGICQDNTSQCSIRAAVEESNVFIGSDTIEVPQGNYELDLGQLQITDSVTINGAGIATTIIDGNNTGRIFLIDNPGGTQLITVSLDSIGIQNGNINGNGGGIWNDEKLFLNNVAINNNQSNYYGGGIYSEEGSVNISNSEISNNQVPEASDIPWGGVPAGGGGIYNINGNIYITNTTMQSNTVTGNINIDSVGGAAIFMSDGMLTCEKCLIKNNKVTSSPGSYGAIVGWYSDININNSRIEANESCTDDFMEYEFGGGFHLYNGEAFISNSEFLNNTALNGSAISTEGGSITITQTLVKGNEPGTNNFLPGGTIYLSGETNNLISDSVISDNKIPGIFSLNNVTITRSTISNNLSKGIYNQGNMYIQNSTISGNSSYECGNIDNHDNLYISHSTLSTNDAIGNTDICAEYYSITFTNSIIDTACIGDNLISNGYNLITDNSMCVIPTTTGDIVNNDPQLKTLGNYGSSMPTHAIPDTSPAKDTGTCFDSFGNLVRTDQRGIARDSQCDIGSFEYALFYNLLPLIIK